MNATRIAELSNEFRDTDAKEGYVIARWLSRERGNSTRTIKRIRNLIFGFGGFFVLGALFSEEPIYLVGAVLCFLTGLSASRYVKRCNRAIAKCADEKFRVIDAYVDKSEPLHGTQSWRGIFVRTQDGQPVQERFTVYAQDLEPGCHILIVDVRDFTGPDREWWAFTDCMLTDDFFLNGPTAITCGD